MKAKILLVAACCAMALGGRSLFAQFPGQGGSPMQASVIPAAYGAEALAIASPFTAPSEVILAGHHVAQKCDGKACGGKCTECCTPLSWCHHMAFYGDFLYLRARDAEVAYAVPFDGPVTPNLDTVQVGPIGVLDMDFQSSFRAGMNYYFSECSRLTVEYTMFESGTTDQTTTQAPFVLRSLVSHPATATAAQDFLQADGRYDISFDLLDIDFERLMYYDDAYQLGWVAGIRLAQAEQSLQVDFAGTGTEQVRTDVDFEGAGIRFGLNGESALNCQWLVYGSMMGNLVPGEFHTDFHQSQSYDTQVVNTGWEAGRIVTMWELELGISRVSKCQNYRLNLGYMFSAWTNMVQTDEWIAAVHENSYLDMDSTMTFDGLVARFEARF